MGGARRRTRAGSSPVRVGGYEVKAVKARLAALPRCAGQKQRRRRAEGAKWRRAGVERRRGESIAASSERERREGDEEKRKRMVRRRGRREDAPAGEARARGEKALHSLERDDRGRVGLLPWRPGKRKVAVGSCKGGRGRYGQAASERASVRASRSPASQTRRAAAVADWGDAGPRPRAFALFHAVQCCAGAQHLVVWWFALRCLRVRQSQARPLSLLSPSPLLPAGGRRACRRVGRKHTARTKAAAAVHGHVHARAHARRRSQSFPNRCGATTASQSAHGRRFRSMAPLKQSWPAVDHPGDAPQLRQPRLSTPSPHPSPTWQHISRRPHELHSHAPRPSICRTGPSRPRHQALRPALRAVELCEVAWTLAPRLPLLQG
jgi:hypothetical protein